MNDRHYPDEEEVEHTGDRDPQPSGGGLTSATGALTPDATGTEPFIPAELREVEGGRRTADRLAPDDPEPIPRSPGALPTESDTYSETEEHY